MGFLGAVAGFILFGLLIFGAGRLSAIMKSKKTDDDNQESKKEDKL